MDTCKEGLGGVPIQEKYFISYMDRNQKEHEKNYSIHDLELSVIVHALKRGGNISLEGCFY